LLGIKSKTIRASRLGFWDKSFTSLPFHGTLNILILKDHILFSIGYRITEISPADSYPRKHRRVSPLSRKNQPHIPHCLKKEAKKVVFVFHYSTFPQKYDRQIVY
jgi:hypothetical protein